MDGGSYLHNFSGLIHTIEYGASTTASTLTPGDVEGRIASVSIQQGRLGTSVPQIDLTYITRHAGGLDVHFPATLTLYSDTGGMSAITTTFDYEWYLGTAQIKSITQTLPVVGTSSNGSGTAATVATVYDEIGRVRWNRDAAGRITFIKYDVPTGQPSMVIQDVDTDLVTQGMALPQGWSAPDGLHLVTEMERESRGRITKLTHPDGTVDYRVYDDVARVTRMYRGWDSTNHVAALPATIVRRDPSGFYSEWLTIADAPDYDSKTDRPTGKEAIETVLSLTRVHLSKGGQVVARDEYYNLGSLKYSTEPEIGTSTANYLRTSYSYTHRGLLNRVLNPDGVITRIVRDGFGRPVSTWIGSDDEPEEGFWHLGNTEGTDLVKLVEYQYDAGGLGDSNISRVTEFTGSGSRVTQLGYDWRNRLVAVKQGHQSSTESLTLNRPLVWFEYDNLDRLLVSSVYDGDRQTIAAISPSQPATSLRRAHTVTDWDTHSRPFEVRDYGVDSSDGSLTSTPRTTSVWYDERGLPVKIATPSGLIQKTIRDSLGRPAVMLLTDGGGDTDYLDAFGVVDDIVWQQTEFEYNAAGRARRIVQKERMHGATDTGLLDGPTTGTLARTTYAGFYYDTVGRITDTVQLGTNGNTEWTWTSTVPTTGAIRTSYAWLDEESAIEITDPNGIVARSEYDMLGRTLSHTAAHGTAVELTTKYAYNSFGQLDTVAAPGRPTAHYSYDYLGRLRSVTENLPNSALRSTIFDYNQLGELTHWGITNEHGGWGLLGETFSYDVVGRLSIHNSYQDLTGAWQIEPRLTSFTHDALGRTLTRKNPRGFTTSYAYNDVARTVSITDPYNNTSVAKFDLAGRMVTIANELGHETTFTYDLLGRVTQIADPLSNATSFHYWVDGTEHHTLAPESRTTRTAFDTFGRVATIFDGENNATVFTYDAGGRVTRVTDPRGTHTDFAYNPLGQTTLVTEAVGDIDYERQTAFTYDDGVTGRLLKITDPLGRITEFAYDAAGRMTSQTLAAGTADEFEIAFSHDFIDRVTKVTRPGGRVTQYHFRPLGDLVKIVDQPGQALERETSFTYDLHGNRTKTTDPLGKHTSYTFDKLDRLEKITDAEGGQTLLAYDAASRLVSLTDPVSNVTVWEYDKAGRTILETDPLGKETHFGYDNANRLVSIEDRLGRLRTFEYDRADRLLYETWYDQAGIGKHQVQQFAFTYDPNGNLLTANEDVNGHNYTLAYDPLNRVTATEQPFGVNLAFTYDKANNRTKVADNKGGITTSGFDNLNRLTSRTLETSSNKVLKVEWDYNTSGDLEKVSRFDWQSNAWVLNLSTEYAFDDLGRVTSIEHFDAKSASVGEYSYAYDLASRLTQQVIVDSNGTQTLDYGYDHTNQLIDDDGTAIDYDANGNRNGTGYTVGTGNRVTNDGTWAYVYDDAGQVVEKNKSGECWTYEYDHRGQLIHASKASTHQGTPTDEVSYSSDAFGNRLTRQVAGGPIEKYVVDGWDTSKPRPRGSENFDVFLELDGSNEVQVRRIFGSGFDNLVARQDSTGGVNWYGTDRQGTVRQIFDNSGGETHSAEYDAFGLVLRGTLLDRYGFHGREHDSLTDLRHHRAREFNGQFWMSEDPIGFAAGDTNLYRFVGNGPGNATDPSGLDDLKRVELDPPKVAADRKNPSRKRNVGNGTLTTIQTPVDIEAKVLNPGACFTYTGEDAPSIFYIQYYSLNAYTQPSSAAKGADKERIKNIKTKVKDENSNDPNIKKGLEFDTVYIDAMHPSGIYGGVGSKETSFPGGLTKDKSMSWIADAPSASLHAAEAYLKDNSKGMDTSKRYIFEQHFTTLVVKKDGNSFTILGVTTWTSTSYLEWKEFPPGSGKKQWVVSGPEVAIKNEGKGFTPDVVKEFLKKFNAIWKEHRDREGCPDPYVLQQ